MSSKPLASLSPGLLARKGAARPAMRPQVFGLYEVTPEKLEDLGWNDMGPPELPVPEPAAPPPPEPDKPGFVFTPADLPPPTPMPPVLALREALKEEIEQPVEEVADEPEPELAAPRPVSLATAARIGRESAKQTAEGGKAAFTLRLDGGRHLKLRLASAIANRSAQQLVTDAVDSLLRTMPEVDALVAQLPEPKRRR